MHFIRARIRRYHRLCNLRDHLKRAGYGDLKTAGEKPFRWNHERHLESRQTYKQKRSAALIEWFQICAS